MYDLHSLWVSVGEDVHYLILYYKHIVMFPFKKEDVFVATKWSPNVTIVHTFNIILFYFAHYRDQREDSILPAVYIE